MRISTEILLLTPSANQFPPFSIPIVHPRIPALRSWKRNNFTLIGSPAYYTTAHSSLPLRLGCSVQTSISAPSYLTIWTAAAAARAARRGRHPDLANFDVASSTARPLSSSPRQNYFRTWPLKNSSTPAIIACKDQARPHFVFTHHRPAADNSPPTLPPLRQASQLRNRTTQTSVGRV